MASELARTLKALPPKSGLRIRVALDFHNLKQYSFAEQIGTDETRVSQLMNGRRPWTSTEKSKAADILGVPEALLFPEVAA